MTISQQPPEKSSDSEASRSFHIPARPSTTPAAGQQLPTWKKPELEYGEPASLEQTQNLHEADDVSLQDTATRLRVVQSQAELEPLEQATVSQMPETSVTTQTHANHATCTPQPNDAPKLPTPLPPTSLVRRRRGMLYLALAVLAVLVVVGGLLSQSLLNKPNSAQALNFPSSGPYAQLPLTASQINAIEHLSEHMKYKALASLYVSQMSLDAEIGQLIMVEYSSPASYTTSGYTSDLDYMIHNLQVGGVIMYESNMQTFNQTKNDISHMQARADIPLIISTDEEGGPYVRRVTNIYGPRMSPTDIENTGDVNVATQQGLKVSQQLAALGINQNTTPDVDVNQVNGYDMVTRTFGNTPQEVIKYAGPYLQAMQGNGTIGCLKHFPGLGGASPDAHKTLPVVHSSSQDIYNIDLAPFKYFIQSSNPLLNPGMIMPTDVLMPAIDPKYPAELSHTFMTDILRNQLHYDGVVLTDALYMQGITDTWSMYTASVMALQAGDDMLLGVNGTGQTEALINTIKQALQNGQLTKARIDQSVTRIIALKMQYHLMPTYVPGM